MLQNLKTVGEHAIQSVLLLLLPPLLLLLQDVFKDFLGFQENNEFAHSGYGIASLMPEQISTMCRTSAKCPMHFCIPSGNLT